MGYEAENRQAIVDYLQAGCKGGDMGSVGVEMEHFLLDEDGEPVPYEEKHGRLGVKDVLERLAAYYPEVSRTADGDIMGCSRPSASITIEPAAQIEVSIAPLTSVAQVEAEYRNFRFRLDEILGPAGYSVVATGSHPNTRARDLPLIPKPRYHFMDSYFKAIPGMHAENMMRGSTSLQVSLDFADEADAVRKLRIATLLGPILALLADNSPVFEGEANSQPLRRLRVWRAVDPARCCTIPGLFDADFGFGKYADWLLSTPPIFITKPDEHSTGTMTAAEAYADIRMDEGDVEHLLSMFWPDVRLKRYVEIRQADSLPIGPALGYVALVKGLFYGPASLELLEHLLGLDDPSSTFSGQDVEDAIAAIVSQATLPAAADGLSTKTSTDAFEVEVYGRRLSDWFDALFRIAVEGLGTETEYLEELRDFRGL